MEKFACNLEKICHEKLSAYQEIKETLEEERAYITGMDVDSLWKMTHRKNELFKKIEDIRKEMLEIAQAHRVQTEPDVKKFSLAGLLDSLPIPARSVSDLKKIKVKIDIIKDEISALASDNRRYTTEYLSVLNGIFDTITGSQHREQYTRAGMMQNDNERKYLLRAEV